MNDFYYRKLDSYQLAKQLVKMVYQLLRSFPDSLCETMCQMEIAHEQLYLSEEDYISFENLASRTSMTMMGLKRNYDNKLNSSTND